MELTLSQYSQQVGISYEAVRSSFVAHESELIEGTHYRKVGRKRILLQPGIDFMNDLRGKPLMPIAVPGEVIRLQSEIETLQSRIAELEGELSTAQSEIASQRQTIDDLTAKLGEKQEQLVQALYQITSLQGRLLPEPQEPEAQDEKRGFWARLFRRNA